MVLNTPVRRSQRDRLPLYCSNRRGREARDASMNPKCGREVATCRFKEMNGGFDMQMP